MNKFVQSSRKQQIKIDLTSEVEISEIVKQLVSMGYEREQIVATPGEFSVRGGIIDIYPLTKEYPVRIELFDIEVDSIRSFDADTQRSLEQLEEITIPPATEAILPSENWEQATEQLKVEEKEAIHKQMLFNRERI